MIAKSVRRADTGSPARLVAYITNQARIGDLRSWKETAAYIAGHGARAGRVGAVWATHCASDDASHALIEIEATQALCRNSKANRTYHLVVSFPPGEKPTPEQLHDIEATLCAAIGLGDHQRLAAVHNDTEHFHFHVAINKVHPRSFRNITPYFDQARLQAACVALERKHGLTPTNHQSGRRADKQPARAEAMARHGRHESFATWVRDQAGPALLDAAATGQGWPDLHRAAGRFGLEVRPRGAGLIVSTTGARPARLKASAIDRRLSAHALTAKWGTYQAPHVPAPRAEQSYPRAPLLARKPSTVQLYARYQRDRHQALAERKTARETLWAETSDWRTQLAAWAVQRREEIRSRRYTPGVRHRAYQHVRQDRAEALAKEKARVADAQSALRGKRIPTWPDWLAAQAQAGDAEALAVLRATEQRQAQLGAAILSCGNAEQARHILYQHLAPKVGRNGVVTYHVADGGKVTDRADHIRVDTETASATLLALTLAADRFGGRALKIEGTEAFKRQVVEVAALHDLDVRFADAGLEGERQGIAEALRDFKQKIASLENPELDPGHRQPGGDGRAGRDAADRIKRDTDGPDRGDDGEEDQTPDRGR